MEAVYLRAMAITSVASAFRESPIWIILTASKPICWAPDCQFHQHSFDGSSALCHIDNQPKNILYDGKGYWLVDFSDSRLEAPEYDLTHLFLFWVEEFPTPHLRHYVISFLTAYAEIIQPRAQAWRGCMIANIKRFDERRGRFNHLFRKFSETDVRISREWLIDSMEIHKYFLPKAPMCLAWLEKNNNTRKTK
jgi:hypothetical protein